jgi:LemA protein
VKCAAEGQHSEITRMTRNPLIALVVAALLVFWMVGAYNRLVTLRNAIVQAWAKVDEALRLRTQAAAPLLGALAQPLAAEQGALDAVQAALDQVARMAGVMGTRPVDLANAAAWVSAETRLSAAASRLFALLEQHAELRVQDAVAGGAQAWREADARLAFARQLFNEAAAGYDAAIAVFPTRLLLPMFRFGPAGRI